MQMIRRKFKAFILHPLCALHTGYGPDRLDLTIHSYWRRALLGRWGSWPTAESKCNPWALAASWWDRAAWRKIGARWVLVCQLFYRWLVVSCTEKIKYQNCSLIWYFCISILVTYVAIWFWYFRTYQNGIFHTVLICALGRFKKWNPVFTPSPGCTPSGVQKMFTKTKICWMSFRSSETSSKFL